jgi:hypothetical protein
MSEKNKFFLWLGRIATVVFLLSILAVVGFLSFIFYSDSRASDEVKVDAAVDDKTKDSLKMGALEGVDGTSIQFVRLSTEKSSASGSPYTYGDNYRNILFVDSKTKTSRWLFDNNNYFVDLDIVEGKREDNRCCHKPLFMFYKVIKQDADADREITKKHRQIAALSYLDGSSYQEIINDADRIISGKLVKDETCFAVLYLRAEKLNYACFDPQTFAKRVEFEVPKVGS